jgi:hypothetical protein
MGLLCITLVAAFISVVAPAVQEIDTTYMPTWEVQLVVILKLIVTVLPTGIVASYGWTLFGYIRYKVGDDTITYDLTKLTQTSAWFMSLLTPLTYATNPQIAVVATTIIVGIKSVINQFVETMKTPVVVPTVVKA